MVDKGQGQATLALDGFHRSALCLVVCFVSERATFGVAQLVERVGDDFTWDLVAEQMRLFTHMPNALQRTAEGRRGCNRRVPWPPTLSVGR